MDENEKLHSPLKTIRLHCLSCNDTAMEVKLCPCVNCLLYPFRFGKDPRRKVREYTEEQKALMADRMKNAREAK
jgi:hypothetical protein